MHWMIYFVNSDVALVSEALANSYLHSRVLSRDFCLGGGGVELSHTHCSLNYTYLISGIIYREKLQVIIS